MAQTRPSPTLSQGFTPLGRFLAPYGIHLVSNSVSGSPRIYFLYRPDLLELAVTYREC